MADNPKRHVIQNGRIAATHTYHFGIKCIHILIFYIKPHAYNKADWGAAREPLAGQMGH
jgi:hypothetical protein